MLLNRLVLRVNDEYPICQADSQYVLLSSDKNRERDYKQSLKCLISLSDYFSK